jgi:hypothetical protein
MSTTTVQVTGTNLHCCYPMALPTMGCVGLAPLKPLQQILTWSWWMRETMAGPGLVLQIFNPWPTT